VHDVATGELALSNLPLLARSARRWYDTVMMGSANTTWMRSSANRAGLGVALLLLPACGGDDSGGSESSAMGAVDETWAGYCVATFTESYSVLDPFDDPVFTANPGEQFLLSSYDGGFGEDQADLIVDTAGGPYDFTISAPEGTQDFPFTTDCPFGGGQRYYAVFADVSVYAEAELVTPLCQLTRGTVTPLAGGDGVGYAIAGSGIDFSGPATYEVMLGPYSAQCGDATSGFISVPQTEVFGSTTWLVPFAVILGSS
jgi:hypothetical protein